MATPDFASLPRFDARDFDPPAWAKEARFAWSTEDDQSSEAFKRSADVKPSNSVANGGDDAGAESDNEEDHEDWQDALENPGDLDPWDAIFSVDDLQSLLKKAVEHKSAGNALFVAKPPHHASAIEAYQAALKCLPDCPKRPEQVETLDKPQSQASGIQEVTEEEANAIEVQAEDAEFEIADDEARAREEVEDQIRECTKACWGNLAACYLATEENKEAVDACTKALAIDPHYTKALLRRASANERINTWSSLTSAQDDYQLLLRLVAPSSPQALATRRCVSTLPERIRVQQEKEKDEMLGKLKELGNGLLGKFGLSTDMFKFDQQDGGGYNMRFER